MLILRNSPEMNEKIQFFLSKSGQNQNQKENNVAYSFCVISDDTEYDASAVNAFQEKITSVLKAEYKWIVKIAYFSDGART